MRDELPPPARGVASRVASRPAGGAWLLAGGVWPKVGTAICWVLVAAWAAFAVMRAFGWEHTWYLITLVAFTPYIAIASGFPLLLALLLRRWYAVVAAALTSLALIGLVVPRAFGSPDPGSGPVLRVMSSNLKIGGADPGTIVGLVRAHRIDLLALEEFTPDEQDRLDAAGLDQLLPFRTVTPQPGAYGIGIYSRYPLTGTGAVDLTGGLPQQYAVVRVPGAQPLLFQACHTRAPDIPAYIGDWTRSLDEEPAATPRGPVRLLAGDFNATLDHARMRALLGTGYVDVAARLGDGLVPTWPYDGRHDPPVTLDHLLADPRIGVVSYGASAVPGSDHKAVFATLTLPPV